MKQPTIDIVPRAYAALLASCSRAFLAQDAQPILANDFMPLLKGDWRRQRPEIERALAKRLRGKLASDAADPNDVAKKDHGIVERKGP